jgi:isoamyl acetate esterase
MIFFGANDACLPGQSQHVPLDQYCETLKLLCLHPSVAAHDPQIILVTPPPVNEYQLTILDALKGYTVPQRTAANTRRYADACRKVGEELNLPVVDLWHAFMSKAGWKEGEPLTGSQEVERNEVLQMLLQDGTYLSKWYEPKLTMSKVCISTLKDIG